MGVQRQPVLYSEFKDSLRYNSKILSQKKNSKEKKGSKEEEGKMKGDREEKEGEGGSDLEAGTNPFFSSHLCQENRGMQCFSLCVGNTSCSCLRMVVMLFLQQTTGRNKTKQSKKPTGCRTWPLFLGRSLRTSMYFLNLFFISLVLRRTGVIKHRWRGADNVVVAHRRHHTTLYVFRNLGRPQDIK